MMPIDFAVGFTDVLSLGDAVTSDRPLAMIHARNEAQYEQTAALLRNAIQISDEKPAALPTVYRRITLQDV